MKFSELRQKSKSELSTLLEEKRANIEELRFLINQKKVKNVREISAAKRDVARILTLLRSA